MYIEVERGSKAGQLLEGPHSKFWLIFFEGLFFSSLINIDSCVMRCCYVSVSLLTSHGCWRLLFQERGLVFHNGEQDALDVGTQLGIHLLLLPQSSSNLQYKINSL